MTEVKAPLGLRHAALECIDLKRSVAFYQTWLGFEPYYLADSDWAMLCLADTYLSLVPVAEMGVRENAGSHPTHLGLVYSSRSEGESVFTKMKAAGLKVSKLETHRDGSFGFYLHDPDGNSLECISIPHRSHTLKSEGEAWVLLAHGSRDPRWSKPFEGILQNLQSHVPSIACRLCFMEMAEPSLMSVVEALVADGGTRRIQIFPLFLSSGGAHMQKDVPALVEKVKAHFPAIEFLCAPAVGETSLLQQAMVAAVVRSAVV